MGRTAVGSIMCTVQLTSEAVALNDQQRNEEGFKTMLSWVRGSVRRSKNHVWSVFDPTRPTTGTLSVFRGRYLFSGPSHHVYCVVGTWAIM